MHDVNGVKTIRSSFDHCWFYFTEILDEGSSDEESGSGSGSESDSESEEGEGEGQYQSKPRGELF